MVIENEAVDASGEFNVPDAVINAAEDADEEDEESTATIRTVYHGATSLPPAVVVPVAENCTVNDVSVTSSTGVVACAAGALASVLIGGMFNVTEVEVALTSFSASTENT